MVKFSITLIFIISFAIHAIEVGNISETSRISLGSSDSFSNLFIYDQALKLIASASLMKLLNSDRHASEAIIKIINETSSNKDEILNEIRTRANQMALSDTLQEMERSHDCCINKSRKKVDKLPKNSQEFESINEYIPEAIRKHVHFLINLVAKKGKKDLIYEGLFKLSEQQIFVIKIYPIKNKNCCFTSMEFFVSIKNYEHVLFFDTCSDI